MNLSKRLQAVADLVPQSGCVADIGCDHAYIAIYLVEHEFADKVIACDVNKGPLVHAGINVESAGLESKIEMRLSDGLYALLPGEADAVVIAGMGGNLMAKILSDGMSKISDDTKLILQPQSDVPDFRRFLIEQGFCIECENMIFEDGKYYPMMRAGKGNTDAYTEVEFEYGKLLLEGKNEVLGDYLRREEKQLNDILASLSKQGVSDRSRERIDEIKEKIVINQAALRRFQ